MTLDALLNDSHLNHMGIIQSWSSSHAKGDLSEIGNRDDVQTLSFYIAKSVLYRFGVLIESQIENNQVAQDLRIKVDLDSFDETVCRESSTSNCYLHHTRPCSDWTKSFALCNIQKALAFNIAGNNSSFINTKKEKEYKKNLRKVIAQQSIFYVTQVAKRVFESKFQEFNINISGQIRKWHENLFYTLAIDSAPTPFQARFKMTFNTHKYTSVNNETLREIATELKMTLS